MTRTHDQIRLVVYALVGLLVPVLGAAVGMALIAGSKSWNTREKAIAILAPIGVAVVLFVLVASMTPTANTSVAVIVGLIPVTLPASLAGWAGLVATSGVFALWLAFRSRASTWLIGDPTISGTAS